jgi:hypothetical protein
MKSNRSQYIVNSLAIGIAFLLLSVATWQLIKAGLPSNSALSSSVKTNINTDKSSSKPDSESFRVGYEIGLSPEYACSFYIDLALNSNSNDGIDWPSVIKNEFLEGCMAGQKKANPNAEWNTN